MARGPGFEPALTESESAVLPLNYPHDPAMSCRLPSRVPVMPWRAPRVRKDLATCVRTQRCTRLGLAERSLETCPYRRVTAGADRILRTIASEIRARPEQVKVAIGPSDKARHIRERRFGCDARWRRDLSPLHGEAAAVRRSPVKAVD